MGYIYVSYCLILSLVTLAACPRLGQSRWWAAVVLVLPVATPVFILKLKKGAVTIWLSIFFISFFAVVGTEFFLYTSNKKKPNRLPPIVLEMIQLNGAVKASTIKLYNASAKLQSLTMAQSRITDLAKALDLIKKLRQMVEQNRSAIDRLIGYTHDHGEYLKRQNLDWAFLIHQFYTDPNVTQHHDSRMKYLAAFEAMLQYTYDNFDNIMELQSSQHMANYDAYYMRYRGVADMHNLFNKKRLDFQKGFIQNNPIVKPFLPGEHQLGDFKFWDKFSF
ncbi:MAG: hypothetical protein GY710_21305 [Desulfobacteraceae bacterium]|nr:hypothetical protein [Desulfobacteraceae bacterium]